MDVPGPSTTSTVSASGVEAIEATIEVAPLHQISEWPLEQVYEVERTVQEIFQGGWTKVRGLAQYMWTTWGRAITLQLLLLFGCST